MRALVRRAELIHAGADPGFECDGTCGGLPSAHPGECVPHPETRAPSVYGWTGGDLVPLCIEWASQSEWVGAVMRSVSWANAGQALGALDALPPALADGVLVVKAEWNAVESDRMAESRRKAASHGHR